MKFQFESVADFMTMSGHGSYVWAAYAITFFALICLLVVPVLEKKNLVARHQKQRKLNQQNPDSQS